MDGKEYLSMKYKLHLQNNDTCLHTSSLTVPSNEQEPKSVQTGTTKDKSCERIEDTNMVTNTSLTPSSLKLLSAPQSHTTESSKRIKASRPKHSPSQSLVRLKTEDSENLDPCRNCSDILKYTAQFLTKIELRYGITSPAPPMSSSMSSLDERSWRAEQPQREEIQHTKKFLIKKLFV